RRDDVIFHLFAQRDELDPFRRPFRSVLLIEHFTVDTIRKTNERQRPALDMVQQRRGDLQVVLNDLRLDDMVFGKEYFIQIGYLYLAFSYLNTLLFGH